MRWRAPAPVALVNPRLVLVVFDPVGAALRVAPLRDAIRQHLVQLRPSVSVGIGAGINGLG
jgi:hypothetical protein